MENAAVSLLERDLCRVGYARLAYEDTLLFYRFIIDRSAASVLTEYPDEVEK